MTNNLRRLDDEDYPAVSMGQAAELLGVQPAFLRSLDTSGVLQPYRTDGGHRRYSRRQLTHAARLRELLDAGHTLVSAQAITTLEQQLDDTETARRRADSARDEASGALEDARADLRTRSDELATAQGELQDAREQITELNDRLRGLDERTG
ncbi:MerR family transcriptional regulator [Pseudonocardia sp. N23]|uniref:helix-turn-helix domain-containing protein n=1 Tax=Pseudonocardia sp. N23 TaxID=1987376 RepID=UPI000C036279|nr:MerR family transcriptional regulator [Pseudonocardia sp. N23]GAY10982.1 HspR, transcriptional repressor of DnaK operon [Pseudonocardia sp. N23]